MVRFFRAEDGSAPFLDWFERLPASAKIQCRARLQLLADERHRLRRPAADYLRDDIYELRAKSGRVQYRMLYFFHGRSAVIVTHGFTKRGSEVPPIEIERARARMRAYLANPDRHTYSETLG